MKYILSPKLILWANRAAKIPGVKAVLKPIYYPYKKYLEKKRNETFVANGLKVLGDFDRIMTSNNYNYSVFAGTLLGAIREKSFLKHDMDIDTMLFYEDYSEHLTNILIEGGFKLRHRFEIENGDKGLEETYEKDNVTIDVFYIHSDEKFLTYQCDFRPVEGCTSWEDSMNRCGYVVARRNEFPVSHEVRRVEFESIQVNAIVNAEEWLALRYGADFMIPNPQFNSNGENPRMNLWTDVKAKYYNY